MHAACLACQPSARHTHHPSACRRWSARSRWVCLVKTRGGVAGNSRRLTRAGAWCRRQAAKVGLSAVLAQLPALFDERKITVVERGVGAVDDLPPRYRNVKVAHQLALHACRKS